MSFFVKLPTNFSLFSKKKIFFIFCIIILYFCDLKMTLICDFMLLVTCHLLAAELMSANVMLPFQ